MIRRPPRSTRTDTLFPYTTLFRSLSDLTTAASAADEAALVITDLGGPWLVTVASGGRTKQYLLAADAPVNALVGRLRAAIDDGAIDRFDRRTAADLYTLLVPAETDAILRPARRLSVVANGPLGALRSEGGPGGEEG